MSGTSDIRGHGEELTIGTSLRQHGADSLTQVLDSNPGPRACKVNSGKPAEPTLGPGVRF